MKIAIELIQFNQNRKDNHKKSNKLELLRLRLKIFLMINKIFYQIIKIDEIEIFLEKLINFICIFI
jgi:hypothetical protein